jgi:predicted nucleic acid-binding protein
VNWFYLDASALAKRYAPEPGSVLVDHLLAGVPAHRLSVFNVSMAEVVSLLVRKRNTGVISTAALSQAVIDLGAEIATTAVTKIVADDALVQRSFGLIRAHSINFRARASIT